MRISRAKKFKTLVIGGPYGSKYLMLSDSNTMVFSVGGYRGRYFHGRWEDV